MFSWFRWPWSKKPEEAKPQFGGAGASGDFEPLPPVRVTPRGIRNNNPGNIEAGATRWRGQTGDDGRFCTFVDAHHGLRALALLLLIYRRKYGLATITGIISRWAPGTENNTAAYIAAVSRDTHFPATKTLDVESSAVLEPLVAAIVKHENGYNPYTMETIHFAVRAALASMP